MCSMDSFHEMLEAFERAWHDRQTSGPSMASQLRDAGPAALTAHGTTVRLLLMDAQCFVSVLREGVVHCVCAVCICLAYDVPRSDHTISKVGLYFSRETGLTPIGAKPTEKSKLILS